jgi:bacillithiol biosynthesis cysteine-adding enzyme BshC
MANQYIPYKETGFFSRLVLDYLDQDPKLDSFYQYSPQLSSFPEIIANQKKREINRKVLVDSIHQGYSLLERENLSSFIMNEKVRENIQALGEENCFTITTGHQLNLFSGPLYTIFKIISIIKLSEEVEKANPGTKIIPLFWMATEDHDFAEINHVKINGKTISWDESVSGATGKISTKNIGGTLSRFLSSLGLSENYAQIENILKSSYTPAKPLSQATMALYHQIFGKYGLVILDADHPELKKEFVEIIRKDIHENHSFNAVSETNGRLENLGYSAQVHPRQVNFFYHHEGIRDRWIREADGFSVLNTDKKFSLSEMESLLQEKPEYFSPNVIMRPVYQEKILPNLAYIGGGGELAYWLSLKSTFDFYKVPYPALFLRNSALLVEEKWAKALTRLGFTTKNLFQDNRDLIQQYVLRSSSKVLNLEPQKLEIARIFESIRILIENIDTTLGPSSEALKTKTLNRMEDLEKKMVRKEKNSFDVQISQIIKIKQALFPDHSLQERNQNIFPFMEIHGPEILDKIFEALDPLHNEFAIITL